MQGDSHVVVLFAAAHALVLLVGLVRGHFFARVDYLLGEGALEGLELALRSLLRLLRQVLGQALQSFLFVSVHVAFVDGGKLLLVGSVAS